MRAARRLLPALCALFWLQSACSSDSSPSPAGTLPEDDSGTADPDGSAPPPSDSGPQPEGATDGQSSWDASDSMIEPPPPLPDGSVDGTTPAPDTLSCDVLVVGGSLGGVAAAQEAASWGVHTCLLAEDSWLGGQLTAQGVPPDESFLEFAPGYSQIRQSIRQQYLRTGLVNPQSAGNAYQEPGQFNPGSCWVSRLCAEPKAAFNAVEGVISPLVSQGTLEVFRGYLPKALEMQGSRVVGARFDSLDGTKQLQVSTSMVIDSTELGDLLPMACGDCYRTGTESKADTGEVDAPSQAYPECVQPITYSFVLERRPEGENHTIPEPDNYDPSVYSFHDFADKVFGENNSSFWTYRRLIAAHNFTSGAPNDLAVINWGGRPGAGGNDFNSNCGPLGCNIIDKTEGDQAQILERARQFALGFAYWLQHDAPRQDGSGHGYPNLMLRTDVFDTADGLTRYPYIREARRLKALVLVTEQDIAATGDSQRTRAATRYSDSLGLARYSLIDRHPCANPPPGVVIGNAEHSSVEPGSSQIPMGALIPERIDGLLAGAKNIGTTHISNGIYRLHPVEWNIGLAAGAAAAMSVQEGTQPRQIRSNERLLRKLQLRLITERGGPIYWTGDRTAFGDWPESEHVFSQHPAYVAAQMLGVAGVIIGDNGVAFHPNQTLTRGAAAALIVREMGIPQNNDCSHPAFSDVSCSHPFYGFIQALADRHVASGTGGGQFNPDAPVTRAQFITFLVRAACSPEWSASSCPLQTPGSPSYNDLPSSSIYYSYVETAKSRGWLGGEADGANFSPDATTTRASAALWLWNHMKQNLGL